MHYTIYLCAARKCGRRQYNGVRTAAQFLTPLLSQLFSDKSIVSSSETLKTQLLGAPSSLAHEGPLSLSHLNVFASIRDEDLVRMFDNVMSEMLSPPPSSHVEEMWPLSMQKVYTSETLQIREKESNHSRPSRFEAGLTALRVFGELHNCNGDHSLSQRWKSCIDDYTLMLPDRSPLHELKNLPQEIGIGELLLSTLGKDEYMGPVVETILDVGGGNGFLAMQLAEVFRCQSVVIDPFIPKHAIDNSDFPHWSDGPRKRPRVLHRSSLHRIQSRVADVKWHIDTASVNFDRCILVAKHLCGTAIDDCFQHLAASNRLPRVILVIPCCFNKGHYKEYCNRAYIDHTVGVHTEVAWDRWTRLTDWNRSCIQENTCCPSSGRRTKLHDMLPCVDSISTLVETILNRGRVLWLRQMGYDAFTVAYVPRCVTPKNRAIIAVRRNLS